MKTKNNPRSGFFLARLLAVLLLFAAGIALTVATLSARSHPNAVPAGGTVTQTLPVDDDHDGIPDDLEQKLADLYAPVLYFEPDESNYPVNVPWMLARAHMQYHEDCGSDVDYDIGPNPVGDQLLGPDSNSFWAASANCGQRDTGCHHPPHRDISTVATDPDGNHSLGGATTGYSDQQTFDLQDLPDSQHIGSTNPQDWVTYFHAYPSSHGGIIIQYWHVYAYNAFGADFDDHGGDWDASIQVKLDEKLQLVGVWFSRHLNDHPGDFFPVDSSNLVRLFQNTHPVVTIDGGGHAAYRSPDDWAGCNCRKFESLTGPIGTISWTSDSATYDDPTALLEVNRVCGADQNGVLSCQTYLSSTAGGVIWKTWTGGGVTAAGNLTNPIVAPSAHGGLINLGEYNPCTPTTCNGSQQVSTFLAGQFYPMNNAFWLRFEGRWGSVGEVNSGPRGPVFQGFEDHCDDGTPDIYKAWYNEGASNPPTNDGAHPWLVPPSTTVDVGTPSLVSGGTTYVVQTTNYTLSASQTDTASKFGAITTYYRFYQQGGVAPAFSIYAGPFSLASGQSLAPDGNYSVDYYSTDGLGNVEAPHTFSVTLATASPPGATTCNGVYGGSFKGNMTVSNGQVCTLFNGSVTGNVTVNPGGSFVLNNGSATGNVQLQGGGNLGLTNATVGGNVQINGGGTFGIGPGAMINGNLEIQNIPAGPAHNQICGTTVRGNLQFHNNGTAVDIGAAGCIGNSVGGDLQVQNNKATVKIFGNTVGHNLQCTSNSPAPAGSGNSAAAKQGQCSSF